MVGRPHFAFPLLHVIVVAAVAVSGMLAFGAGRNVVRHYQLQRDERALHAELQQLDRDHAQLSSVRQYLESDEYIEDIARRVLGLVRPGETLVIVNGPTPTAPLQVPQPDPAAPWWKDLFIAPEPQPTIEPQPADGPFQ